MTPGHGLHEAIEADFFSALLSICCEAASAGINPWAHPPSSPGFLPGFEPLLSLLRLHFSSRISLSRIGSWQFCFRIETKKHRHDITIRFSFPINLSMENQVSFLPIERITIMLSQLSIIGFTNTGCHTCRAAGRFRRRIKAAVTRRAGRMAPAIVSPWVEHTCRGESGRRHNNKGTVLIDGCGFGFMPSISDSASATFRPSCVCELVKTP